MPDLLDLSEPRPRCPDCEVAISRPHVDGCDVARCLRTGLQRLSCERNHNCGKDTWSGRWPGETDCERLGWMIGPGLPRPEPAAHRGDVEPRHPAMGRRLLADPNHPPNPNGAATHAPPHQRPQRVAGRPSRPARANTAARASTRITSWAATSSSGKRRACSPSIGRATQAGPTISRHHDSRDGDRIGPPAVVNPAPPWSAYDPGTLGRDMETPRRHRAPNDDPLEARDEMTARQRDGYSVVPAVVAAREYFFGLSLVRTA